MATVDNENLVKTSNKYNCSFCNYYTSRKYNLELQNKSKKHIDVITAIENNSVLVKVSKHQCSICSKIFNDRSGLWRHKKSCEIVDNTINDKNLNDKLEIYDLVKYLMKENSELKTMIIEQQNIVLEIAKNGTTNNSHNNTNSHNQAFNLQFFLNETCKDAMNITDFVESIQFQLSDLERVGEVGYVEGISNIIVKNLNKLDVTQRPVHCTDKKRETMYIKDADKWEKDEEQNKLRKVIKTVASKNARLLPKFKEKYPDYGNYHSKNSDKYSKIIVESMGGSGNNDAEKEEKIIRNIAKNVVVDKE